MRTDICESMVFAGFALGNMPLREKSPGLERRHGKLILPQRIMKYINTNFPIGDFLIRVKNAAMAKNKELIVPMNKEIVNVAEAMVKAGFLDSAKKEKTDLRIALTFKDKKPRLSDLKLISKPGLRVYMGIDELESKRGPSIYLVSTPKGVLTSLKAIKERTGGEVIAEIW